LFVNPVGSYVESSALRRRFYAARDAAGLEPIRFHDLRHTFGTIAVQAFPLTDVKAFMGHADIQTTMIYIHHVPQRDAAEKLSRLVELRTEERESGARWVHGAPQEGDPENEETPAEQGFRDAGGRIRTCDTRIMIPLL
jgi:hypothetical protein